MTPTPEDMARNLEADLKYVNAYGKVQVNHVAPWSAAIRRALAAEGALEGVADSLLAHAATLIERADADPLTLKYDKTYRQAAHDAAAELRDAALLVREKLLEGKP
jgi:hypothetical protein